MASSPPRARTMSMGVMADMAEQLQALFYRRVQLSMAQAGTQPPPPPAALITPGMTRVMALQLPDVLAALQRLQGWLVGLVAAGSLGVAELLEHLRAAGEAFNPSSRPSAAARLFAFETLAAALARVEEHASRKFTARALEGFDGSHLEFCLDGLLASLHSGEDGEISEDPSSPRDDVQSIQSMQSNAGGTGGGSTAAGAAEECLTLLSRHYLSLMTKLVVERIATIALGGTHSRVGGLSGAFSSMSVADSTGWETQARYMAAAGKWRFGLLEEETRGSTCMFLATVRDAAVPLAARSFQRSSVILCLTDLWRGLLAESRASPQSSARWGQLVDAGGGGPLGGYFELVDSLFTVVSKWLRKSKVRTEAVALMQAMLCHGSPEAFNSKKRPFFISTLTSAASDPPSRLLVLPVIASYLREVPEPFFSPMHEQWKAEAMTLMAAAFPRRTPALLAELQLLAGCLTALAVTELPLAVCALQRLLASPRHHSSHKIVALRALGKLLAAHPVREIAACNSEVVLLVTAAIADTSQPALSAEGLHCLALLLQTAPDAPPPSPGTTFTPPETPRYAGFGTPDKQGGQREHSEGPASQAEVLRLVGGLSLSEDRTLALEAAAALRANLRTLPMRLLAPALRIMCRTITEAPLAPAEDWRRRLGDIKAVVGEYYLRFTGAPPKQGVSPRASTSKLRIVVRDESQAGGEITLAEGAELPSGAQWCRLRVKLEGIVVLALTHSDKGVWDLALELLKLLDSEVFRALEAPLLSPNSRRQSAPEAASLLASQTLPQLLKLNHSGPQASAPTKAGSEAESNGALGEGVEHPPFLADQLLRHPLQGAEADMWSEKGAWCGVAWCPELWQLLLGQYEKYELVLQWAWSKLSKHNLWIACPRHSSLPASMSPRASTWGSAGGQSSRAVDETTAWTDFQQWRNVVHFLCAALRLPQHPEVDLDRAAKTKKRATRPYPDPDIHAVASPSTPKVRGEELTDEEARGWVRKRRMPRPAVKECLQRAWEHTYTPGVAPDTPEMAALLASLEALHPSCHEALILELKRCENARVMGLSGVSVGSAGSGAPTHFSSGSSGLSPSHSRRTVSPTVGKRPGGNLFESAGGSDFYYQECVLELLSRLYGRTLPYDYRSAPVPVRSALEEFVGAWTRESDVARFQHLSVRVRKRAVHMLELYLLYTTSALQAVAAQAAQAAGSTPSSSASTPPPSAAFHARALVPSLIYRKNMFVCLTERWLSGAANAALASLTERGIYSEAMGGPERSGEGARALQVQEGEEDGGLAELESAVLRAVTALVGMGLINDRDFENTILRYLQTHHARGGAEVREDVTDALSLFLEHNPHRLRSFIAGSFAGLHREMERAEAAELGVTYFRAVVRCVLRSPRDWLPANALHPARVAYLSLLHMSSPNLAMRHLARHLINTVEAASDTPAPPGRGDLPCGVQATPAVLLKAAVAASQTLAAAHPDYTPHMLKEALALQQILSRDSLPTMLAIIAPWARNFDRVFLADPPAPASDPAPAVSRAELPPRSQQSTPKGKEALAQGDSGPQGDYKQEADALSENGTEEGASQWGGHEEAGGKERASASESVLLSLFQATRLCGWPPLHSNLLRPLWEGVVEAPPFCRERVAFFVADFLLACHMSAAEQPAAPGQHGGRTRKNSSMASAPSPSTQSLQSAGQRSSFRERLARGAVSEHTAYEWEVAQAGLGLDQRLAKLALGYLMATPAAPPVFTRLVAALRSYSPEPSGAHKAGEMVIAWAGEGGFRAEPVYAREHSALVLLAEAAYQQEAVLLQHLPTLLHAAVVLLRPRQEHSCPESHALLPHLVHSLAVRSAATPAARERGQVFMDAYYPPDPSTAVTQPSPAKPGAAAGGDPEERLASPFLLELVSLLLPLRPTLRYDWAALALAWTAGCSDRRIVLDSLRTFAVVNQSMTYSTLAKASRLLLAAVRLNEYAIADGVLDIFAKAVYRLCRQSGGSSPAAKRREEAEEGPAWSCWEMLAAVTMAALAMPSVRLFQKALTMAELLFALQIEQSATEGVAAAVASLEPFWRCLGPSVPLDVAVSDLLFPGLLAARTAAATLWLYEAFAVAYAELQSGESRLVVLVLLLNAALVHLGEEGRCKAALRFIDSAGLALADVSSVFAAYEAGDYKPGATPRPPRRSVGGAPARPHAAPTEPNGSVASVSDANGGVGVEETEARGVEQASTPGGATTPGGRQSVVGVGAASGEDYRFFDDFFDAFSLAFSSEQVWEFALEAVLGIIERGQARWRPSCLKLLRSLLLYHVHAWSDAHFAAVADLLVKIAAGEVGGERGKGRGGGDAKAEAAYVGTQEDIRALLLECASYTVSKRVFDALRPAELSAAGQPNAGPLQPLMHAVLPPGALPSARSSYSASMELGSGQQAKGKSGKGGAEDVFPGYQAGSARALERIQRAEKWFEGYIFERDWEREVKETPSAMRRAVPEGSRGVAVRKSIDGKLGVVRKKSIVPVVGGPNVINKLLHADSTGYDEIMDSDKGGRAAAERRRVSDPGEAQGAAALVSPPGVARLQQRWSMHTARASPPRADPPQIGAPPKTPGRTAVEGRPRPSWPPGGAGASSGAEEGPDVAGWPLANGTGVVSSMTNSPRPNANGNGRISSGGVAYSSDGSESSYVEAVVDTSVSSLEGEGGAKLVRKSSLENHEVLVPVEEARDEGGIEEAAATTPRLEEQEGGELEGRAEEERANGGDGHKKGVRKSMSSKMKAGTLKAGNAFKSWLR